MSMITEWEAKEIEAEMKARWQIRFDVDTDIPLRYMVIVNGKHLMNLKTFIKDGDLYWLALAVNQPNWLDNGLVIGFCTVNCSLRNWIINLVEGEKHHTRKPDGSYNDDPNDKAAQEFWESSVPNNEPTEVQKRLYSEALQGKK